MNDLQQRAVWACALRQLAQFIEQGSGEMPSRIDLWTQFVHPSKLLEIAEFSGDESLPIKGVGSKYPTVTIPVGKLLDIPLVWHFQSQQSIPDVVSYEQHNANCVK